MFEDDHLNRAIEIVWRFLEVRDTPKKADAIFVFGCVNLLVPKYAADLYQQSFAPVVVVSGAMGKSAAILLGKPECDAFHEVLVRCGVPPQAILLERNATNTGENILFGMRILREQGVDPKRIVFVALPYHSKRCLATFQRHEPHVEVISSPVPGSFSDFTIFTKEKLALKLVGEIDRLIEYPKMGLIVFNETIPVDVLEATEYIRNQVNI